MGSTFFIRRITAEHNFDERNDQNRNFMKLNSLLGQNVIKCLTTLYIKIYANDLRSIIDILFHDNYSTPLSIKVLELPLTFNRTLCMSTEASSLGILISFVNNFHFYLDVMFMCAVK